jgi:hypothetical protein
MNYYTYTIHFVDGYYYHGYHKHEGVDPLTDGYFGSPVTHREKWLTTMHWKEITGLHETIEKVTFAEQEAIRPVYNTDPYCLNANCNGIPTREQAVKGAKKAGKKAGQRAKENKTNVCDPANQEKGRQTAKERGSGFFDSKFQQSEMMQEIRRQNGIKTGMKARETNQIAHARSFIDKENQRRAGTENLKKAHQKMRRAVEVLTPQGVLLYFESISEASKSLNIDSSCISHVAKNPGKRTKGHQARFADKGKTIA